MKKPILLCILALSCCLSVKPVCNSPYIAVGTGCCLDSKGDGVCDQDRTTTLMQSSTTSKVSSSTTTTLLRVLKLRPNPTTTTLPASTTTVRVSKKPVLSGLKVDIEATYLSSIMSGVYSQYPGWNASLVSYTVQNNEDRPIALTVSSEIQDFTSIARTTQIIPAHTKKTLQQNPQLKPSVDLQEITPATLHYVISDSFGQTLAEQTLPISLLAKDTMVWSTYDGTEWVDTSGLIAAWVTPNAPAVGELVRKAASKLEGGMGGYQCPLCNGSQDWQINSQRQVQAIYDTLQSDYQIAYVNAPISFSAKGDSTQKIKPPEESIRLSSANCIDGAVLFASAIEYAGMNPYIVISPTHAIVCWGISGNEGSIDCLETTYVGRYGFAEANAKGYEEYTRLQQDGDFQASRARILSIKDLRASGIRPMS